MVEYITFKGTRNEFLTVAGLAPYIYGLTYDDIGDVLQQTEPFKSLYAGAVVPDEHQNAYYNGEWYETSTIPDVALIRGSLIDPGVPTLATNTGLVGTVLTAFNSHNNLQFRPDDLWISILAQFSAYVNGRAEELRSRIVNHEGQKNLEVTSPGDIFTADFGAMNRQFLDKISENIKDASLREWFLPGFSTTTDTDEICAAAMAMCSFQEYFTYKFGLICGIPQVSLLGSVDDWKLLRDKVERLAEFDGEDKILSEQWVPRLREILDNFVESAKNGSTNNLDFWNHIVSNTGSTCGGPELLTGWISTFSVFNDKGDLYADMTDFWPTIRLDDIHHNIASCPATINDNGLYYNATLFVGQMAYDFEVDVEATENIPDAVAAIQSRDGAMRKLKPRNDWALAISSGFQQVPPIDPDEQYLPDGTIIFGSQCKIGDYVNSSGELYDPLHPLNEADTVQNTTDTVQEASGDSVDIVSSGNDTNLVAADVANGSESFSHVPWIVPLVVFNVLFVVLWIFVLKRGKASHEEAVERPSSSAKLKRTTGDCPSEQTEDFPNESIARAVAIIDTDQL
jgi:hypothetical protein